MRKQHTCNCCVSDLVSIINCSAHNIMLLKGLLNSLCREGSEAWDALQSCHSWMLVPMAGQGMHLQHMLHSLRPLKP